mmetsp:Transcript_137869/g.243610  ORF Transcript_137869/g.243610 Transcript_137869/m.243610 type:complete len:104 (-) Transcript_137869:426-737(-)
MLSTGADAAFDRSPRAEEDCEEPGGAPSGSRLGRRAVLAVPTRERACWVLAVPTRDDSGEAREAEDPIEGTAGIPTESAMPGGAPSSAPGHHINCRHQGCRIF